MSLKIVALGEALFDLYESEQAQENLEIDAFSGGAPMNFICACSKFGADKCLFYTNLTNSSFSKKIKQILKEFKVKVRTRRRAGEPPAAMVMENGKFNFFISPQSFKFSSWAFKKRDFKNADIFHFGSMFLATREGYRATRKAIKRARRYGVKISFDINYREQIINLLKLKEKKFIKRVKKIINSVDIIKVNESEAETLFGSSRTKKIFKYFSNKKNVKKVCVVTRGRRGADVIYNAQVYSHPAFKAENFVDATGAGDIFFAGFIMKITANLRRGELREENIKSALEFATHKASSSTKFKGALTSLAENEDD